MTRFVFIFALLLPAPLLAQAEDDGRDLLERGAQMFLEGLMREMEPALEDLQDLGQKISPALKGFMMEMGPALEDLMDKVEDWRAYHPPEVLDNGDIIIRRKVPEAEADDIEI